jgi:hypothetical protein
VIGVDRAKMKLYDVEQSAQDDIVQEPQYDDSIPVFDRKNKKDFSQLF